MYKEITFSDKILKLKVDFDCLDNEVPSTMQLETLKRITENPKHISSVLPEVIEYCLQEPEMRGITHIDNILKYVKPRTLFIPQTNKGREVAILCDYMFDKEHGIAITFKNEIFSGIKSQDDVI